MGNETLIGGDLSHHNYGKENPNNWSFVFLKATEGRTYKDAAMNKYLSDMAKAKSISEMPFIGFYHFAHPENNTFRTEADHFLNTISQHIGNCMTALDWEDKALQTKGGEIWALQWLRMVKENTGGTPLFYVSESQIKNYPKIVAEFPIWVAHYHGQNKHDNCGTYAMWQITSNPFDIDVFNGGEREMTRLITGD